MECIAVSSLTLFHTVTLTLTIHAPVLIMYRKIHKYQYIHNKSQIWKYFLLSNLIIVHQIFKFFMLPIYIYSRLSPLTSIRATGGAQVAKMWKCCSSEFVRKNMHGWWWPTVTPTGQQKQILWPKIIICWKKISEPQLNSTKQNSNSSAQLSSI